MALGQMRLMIDVVLVHRSYCCRGSSGCGGVLVLKQQISIIPAFTTLIKIAACTVLVVD